MDKLSGLASKLGGSSSDTSGNTSSSSTGQEDYLDKGEFSAWHHQSLLWAHIQTALGTAETKFGGGKIDPEKMRSTNEKITDGIREQFEKTTGYEYHIFVKMVEC